MFGVRVGKSGTWASNATFLMVYTCDKYNHGMPLYEKPEKYKNPARLSDNFVSTREICTVKYH